MPGGGGSSKADNEDVGIDDKFFEHAAQVFSSDNAPKRKRSSDKTGIQKTRKKSIQRSFSLDSVLEQQRMNDKRAIELAITNIRNTFCRYSTGDGGGYQKDTQQLLDTMAMGIMSEEMVTERLMSALERVFGISRKIQTRGLRLIQENSQWQGGDHNNPPGTKKIKPLALTVRRCPKSYGRLAPLKEILERIMDWFHSSCSLVVLDRSRQDSFTGRYNYKIAGAQRKITCQRKLAYATVAGLVENLKASSFFSHLITELGRTINDKKLAGCICKCISPKTIQECSCPICVEFMLMLKAWNTQRVAWRKNKTCSCPGCSSSKLKGYMEASHDIRSLMRVVCCPKVARNDLRLPHTPDNPPFFWRLKCCKKNERTPHHVATCSECGWARRLYECPLEWTQAPAHFMRWEPTELPGTTKKGGEKYAKVLRRIDCTCVILLQTIQKKHRAVMYHLWVDAMTKHQERLDVATFDGKSAIIIKTDFAATAKLQVRLKIFCNRI